MALRPNPQNVGINPNIVTDALKSASSDKYRQEALAMQKASHAAQMDFTKMKKDEAEWGFSKNQWLNNEYASSMTGENAFLQPDGSLNFNSLNSKITPEKIASDFEGMGKNRFSNIVELQQGASAINSMSTMKKAREVLAYYENQIAQGKSEKEISKPFHNDTFRNWYYTNKTNPDPKVQQMVAMIPFEDKGKRDWGVIGQMIGDEDTIMPEVATYAALGAGQYTSGLIKASDKNILDAKAELKKYNLDSKNLKNEMDEFRKKNKKYFKKDGSFQEKKFKNLKSKAVIKKWQDILDKDDDLKSKIESSKSQIKTEKASIRELKKDKWQGKGLKASSKLLRKAGTIGVAGQVGDVLLGETGGAIGTIGASAYTGYKPGKKAASSFTKFLIEKLPKRLSKKVPGLVATAMADSPAPGPADLIALAGALGLSAMEIYSLYQEYQGK